MMQDATAATRPVTPIGPDVIGRFSFLALYPFDTQVILRIPPRWSTQGSGDRDTPEQLRDQLNAEGLIVKPELAAPPLKFSVEPLTEIFTDSPNATWSVLSASLPGQWFLPALTQGALPPEVELANLTARLLLFDGGITILALEPTFLLRNPEECQERLPDIIKQAGEQTVRYENEAVTSFCRSLLGSFGSVLHNAVTERKLDGTLGVRKKCQSFVDRIRTISRSRVVPDHRYENLGPAGISAKQLRPEDVGSDQGDVSRRLRVRQRPPQL